jgi:hypothetical protein
LWQVGENLSPSGIPIIKSICVPQICLRVQIILATAAVVQWWWGGQLELSSREWFSRGLSLIFSGGQGVDLQSSLGRDGSRTPSRGRLADEFSWRVGGISVSGLLWGPQKCASVSQSLVGRFLPFGSTLERLSGCPRAELRYSKIQAFHSLRHFPRALKCV